MPDLVGKSVNPPRGRKRIPMMVAPAVRDRLRTLLFEPEMHAVGYSEFLNRACEIAETEIMQKRSGHGKR